MTYREHIRHLLGRAITGDGSGRPRYGRAVNEVTLTGDDAVLISRGPQQSVRGPQPTPALPRSTVGR